MEGSSAKRRKLSLAVPGLEGYAPFVARCIILSFLFPQLVQPSAISVRCRADRADCAVKEVPLNELNMQVKVLINDRVDVALAVDADGVHVGQDDIPAKVARRLLGPGKILGVSVKTVEQALRAEADGADYLGAGASVLHHIISSSCRVDCVSCTH